MTYHPDHLTEQEEEQLLEAQKRKGVWLALLLGALAIFLMAITIVYIAKNGLVDFDAANLYRSH
jgi:uncharacterized integral membrane protein